MKKMRKDENGKRNFRENLKELSFPHKCCMAMSVILIMSLVFFQKEDVYYSFVVLGESPSMGFVGLLIFALLFYLGVEFQFLFFCSRYMGWISLIIPFVLFFVYCEFYGNYVHEVYWKIMYESGDKYVIAGVVYNKRSTIGRGVHDKLVKVGYDKTHKSTVLVHHKIYDKINIGDTVILEVPQKYPRVMEILKWNPTLEEKERYKVARKFVAYINGTIYDEEVVESLKLDLEFDR